MGAQLSGRSVVYFLKADWLHNFDRLEAKQQAKAA